jgi:hypothetical protein
MSIHPSDRKYHCFSHWRKFCDIWYRGLTQNSVDKLQIWFKSDDNIGNFTLRLKHFYYIVDKSTNYFVALTTVQREHIVTCPWQHLTVLYCWQQHLGKQQYKGCVSMATMCMGIRHSARFCVRCLSCLFDVSKYVLVIFFSEEWYSLGIDRMICLRRMKLLADTWQGSNEK